MIFPDIIIYAANQKALKLFYVNEDFGHLEDVQMVESSV